MHSNLTLGPARKYGIASCALAAMIATESEGVTKNLFPKTIFLSPSPVRKKNYYSNYAKRTRTIERCMSTIIPSLAAPKSGPSSRYMTSTKSFAYLYVRRFIEVIYQVSIVKHL